MLSVKNSLLMVSLICNAAFAGYQFKQPSTAAPTSIQIIAAAVPTKANEVTTHPLYDQCVVKGQPPAFCESAVRSILRDEKNAR
jgi:hypothetical protein